MKKQKLYSLLWICTNEKELCKTFFMKMEYNLFNLDYSANMALIVIMTHIKGDS